VVRDEDWSRTFDGGVAYKSPAGTTDLYRVELVSEPGKPQTHPEVRRSA
jgi:hypothetical protein